MPKGCKSCPKCRTTTGPKAKSCVCGHQFVIKHKTAEQKEEACGLIPISGNVIVCPAGRCSTDFKGEDVISWANEMNRKEEKKSGNRYGLAALKYFLKSLPLDEDAVRHHNEELSEAFRVGTLS